MDFHHVSVLRKETIANLITDTSGVYVDCTSAAAVIPELWLIS